MGFLISKLWQYIVQFIIGLFQRFRPEPSPPVPLIPHPEEERNPTATATNISVLQVVNEWHEQYGMPESLRPFWTDKVRYHLVEDLHIYVTSGNITTAHKVAAATYSEDLRMEIDPQWCNPGVLAHECAHISFSLLDQDAKNEWTGAINAAVDSSELVNYLWTSPDRSYMRSNLVEAHADIYRFLGEEMPDELRRFYPKLLKIAVTAQAS